MKKIILLFLAVFLISCGAPATHYYQEPQEEPLKFSNDPLLDSIYRDRYLRCLESCGDKDKCK